MTFEEVVNVALIGTSRSTLAFTDSDSTLINALARARHGSAEDQLLSTAAVLAAFESCGAMPTASASAPGEVAAEDHWPSCSRRAAELLARLLALSNTPTKQHLMNEWLVAAARDRKRVSHALLPALLDYGTAHRPTRAAIVAIIDQRGIWLMSSNPRWQYAATSNHGTAAIWSTGNLEQRVSALNQMRQAEPARARELVASTWKEDGADERAAFVAALSTGLGTGDEPFLEAALDDRGKQVRTAAADLLSRLAGSALIQRMIARADPLLSHERGVAGGMLRKARTATISLTLPAEPFDPAWTRDGLTEKAQHAFGARQWWVIQMLAAIPPSYWSAKWDLTPKACIDATAGDFASVFRHAWTDAALRHRDTEWISALFEESSEYQERERNAALYAQLPPDRQLDAFRQSLASPATTLATLTPILDATRFEIDMPMANVIIDHVQKMLDADAAQYRYHLDPLLSVLSRRLPPCAMALALNRWVGLGWNLHRRQLDVFFQTLQLRRDIQAEFAS